MSAELLRLVVRYLPRIRHVLRTEGLPVLVEKIRRRLRTTALVAPRPPRLLVFQPPFSPLSFRIHPQPTVSVIVPVYNNFQATYACLASLHDHKTRYAFEVVVVDDDSTDETGAVLASFDGLHLARNPENLGFVGACNRGAEMARGEFLVFLNNDTQVQPGWLDALVGTFESHADCGLAGSQLLYPDGRLQEAGGIVFSDGSAWGYGHLDDPYRPEYCYVREPDYCSGASLAIRRDQFERLGGFDPHFAPGYYEDTDLAFRVRAVGQRVIYQPHSRVVHLEGATAGRHEEAAGGMKRYQAINRHKFTARWTTELATHGARGQDLEMQKERRATRRALVVDIYMLTPDRESGSLRMSNLIAVLQGLGFKVTYAASNLEAPEPYVSRLQGQGVEVLYRPYVRSLETHLASQGRLYDLAILSRADAASEIMPAVRRHCPKARVIFDTVDLHFLREFRLAELTGDASTQRLAERRKAQELELVDAADVTLVVSDAEREVLRTLRPSARIELVSNIHQIYGSPTPFEARRDCLFIGAFAHPPNRDAVLWLAREILPLVRAEIPDLRCHVIGADPPAEIRALANEWLVVCGYVPDVDPFFDTCRLSVAPLRYGAGVKGKINQSLAHGLPVVTTSQGAEGMYLRDGESALIADDPSTFAAAMVQLYQDSKLWRRLSSGGLAVMETHFSFGAARQAILGAIHE